ncbi:conserved hypothetical protein [Microcystis aeruginosa PCC 9809]|uniref:SPOR domain-containing protein n=3 Tax=Microcystis TaxID=1125 RepID=I4HT19_MICAE|nr:MULTISPECIES: hypothetical protein [Microcystis]MCE2673911.1 hypothetical protein [Microcystis sp. 53598_E5]MDJ0670425.1 hypothetical protein [Microcystis sp. M53598_WE2]CCI25193.1 conserved hypothetical protein [Microcystis aeruginosa PCC 9809]BAG04658.1 hypothetical protein MAE_48360 [Microcystis aeruginosa NIES-843]BBH39634.1 hypothetical protein myaer102_21720 [Microcystis viridis NIES-102]
MRTNLLFFSALFWLKVGIIAQGTLLLKANLSFAQNLYPGRRLPPPPAVRQPTKRSDSPSAVNCSQCSPLNLPPVNSPSVRPPVAAPVSGNQPLREYVFQAPATVRPADATVINNHPRPTVNPPAPRPQNRANKPPAPQQRVIAANQLFRVEVSSNSAEALAKIQEIEPLAFIRAGENVIQAGLFQQQYQAKQRVQELTKQGFSAQIITLNN